MTSTTRKLSSYPKVFTLDITNNHIVLSNSIVFADGTSQNTAGGGSSELTQAAFDKANSANVLAQAAFDKANTDVTNLSISTGTFGNASIIPVFKVEANGRISSIANSTVSIDTSQIASGTLNSARISGEYTGITGVGALANGTWTANSISTTYTDAKITSVGTNTGAISNTQLLNFIITVDGTGSGLDADLLDGLQGISYANASFSQSSYDKANSANVLAQAAYDTANSAISGTIDQVARDTANGAFNKANSANVLAQAAFDKANTGGGGPTGFEQHFLLMGG